MNSLRSFATPRVGGGGGFAGGFKSIFQPPPPQVTGASDRPTGGGVGVGGWGPGYPLPCPQNDRHNMLIILRSIPWVNFVNFFCLGRNGAGRAPHFHQATSSMASPHAVESV